MTVEVGRPYVVRIDDRGLCIALAVGSVGGVPRMCLRASLRSPVEWTSKPRTVPLADVRREATRREVALALAL